MHSSLIPQKLVTYLKKTPKILLPIILCESLMPILTRSLETTNLEVPDSRSVII